MARRFRFGICTDQNMTWEKTVERWQLFERLGFDSAWLCDHLVQPSRPQGPYFEAWTLLAGLAAQTEKIRLGVLVTSNTFRHPSVLGRMAVTVDHISHGRLEVGLGAGWYEPEHTMFGIPFPETRELVSRFQEAVQVVDLLLREDTSSFDGTYYQLRDARSRPRSVQQPRAPLLLGAFGPRMLRITARHADTWNAFGTPAEMRERNQMLDEICREIGRDPDTLDRSLYFWVAKADADPWASEQAFYDVIGPYIEAGVNEFLLDQPRDDQIERLEWVAAEVLPKFARETPRTVQPATQGPIDTTHWERPQDHVQR
jgi:F420-dependent oxidoreductase-like protein